MDAGRGTCPLAGRGVGAVSAALESPDSPMAEAERLRAAQNEVLQCRYHLSNRFADALMRGLGLPWDPSSVSAIADDVRDALDRGGDGGGFEAWLEAGQPGVWPAVKATALQFREESGGSVAVCPVTGRRYSFRLCAQGWKAFAAGGGAATKTAQLPDRSRAVAWLEATAADERRADG